MAVKRDAEECYQDMKENAEDIVVDSSKAEKKQIYADSKKIFSFEVPEETIKELEIISKIYLREKLEKEYK